MEVVAKIAVAHDRQHLWMLAEVEDGSPWVNAGTDPKLVFKNGELVVRDGKVIKVVNGATHVARPAYDKSIEKPPRYRLMAQWETLANHTVDFRGSEDFTAWRALVGQYFAAPPEVEHTETGLTTAG